MAYRNLVDELAAIYPELSGENQAIWGIPNPPITLVDDGDGLGAYIKEWNYHQPLPEGFKLGK